MLAETIRIDIDQAPPIAQLVEEVRAAGAPVILTRGEEELAVITPSKPATKKRRRPRAFTKHDPWFGLVGLGASGIPGGVSSKKHEYLADAASAEVPKRLPRKRARPVTEDDPLFGMMGMVTEDVPPDMAERKHEYLAKALNHE